MTNAWARRYPEKRKAMRKKHYYANREKICAYVKSKRSKYVYGLEPEDIHNIWMKQNKCCAVCGKPIDSKISNRVVIDHDHTTRKVRGILHQRCNHMVGRVETEPELVGMAMRYLMENSNR